MTPKAGVLSSGDQYTLRGETEAIYQSTDIIALWTVSGEWGWTRAEFCSLNMLTLNEY